MIFGFGGNKKKTKKAAKDRDEDEEEELVLFQGAINGVDPRLKENGKLVQAGLVRAKQLVSNAFSRRAEMIRLEPKAGATVATFYVDGVPFPAEKLSPQAGLAVTQMLKLLSGMDIKVRTKPQSGGMNAQFSNVNYLVRADSTPLPGGAERLILRAQDKSKKLFTPDDLGFSDDLRQKIRGWTSQRKGLVLGVGMPMSGVTTTTNALLRGIDGYLYTIYSLTDMTGREVSHVKQFETNPEDNFVQTVGRCKRAEGDVLYIDPIRDAEFAKLVVEEAEDITFLAEFTARDAADAIAKLVEMVGDPKLVSERLTAAVSQKLVRTLCQKCRQAFRPHPKLLAKVGLPPETKVLYRAFEASASEDSDEEPDECEQCGGMGYFGRVALIEAIEMTGAVKETVAGGGDAAAIKAAARKEKMQSFQSDGLRLVAEGRTSLEELQRVFKPTK
ncbi:Putative type II secretion system protein E [Caulifigura coniformis]|uniref:Type II secretion system protein E n=1 Tax=Caulifigura coniformis TaxID=2527983 RepID=A0A517SM03_9PLAN|nr:ATPase, T2SS/T4P/T4SS family [Caulifigura coniformis]QDT57140.1 Putative type II secretion system protein E [Caulifigura coniformis]